MMRRHVESSARYPFDAAVHTQQPEDTSRRMFSMMTQEMNGCHCWHISVLETNRKGAFERQAFVKKYFLKKYSSTVTTIFAMRICLGIFAYMYKWYVKRIEMKTIRRSEQKPADASYTIPIFLRIYTPFHRASREQIYHYKYLPYIAAEAVVVVCIAQATLYHSFSLLLCSVFAVHSHWYISLRTSFCVLSSVSWFPYMRIATVSSGGYTRVHGCFPLQKCSLYVEYEILFFGRNVCVCTPSPWPHTQTFTHEKIQLEIFFVSSLQQQQQKCI